MRIIEVAGTPRTMGAAFGEACREEIGHFVELRLGNAEEQARLYGGRDISRDELLDVARAALPRVQWYAPDGYAELAGIAEGAAQPLEAVWAMNALTDLRDVVAFGHRGQTGETAVRGEADAEGCTSVMAGGRLAQTWDLATDNLPYVLVVRRRPHEGPRTVSLTTTGCLSLIGLNEDGVAVGTTNLRSTDSRLGVGYLDVIHRALGARCFEVAVGLIVAAPRAGAHFFTVQHPSGRGVAVECTATRSAVTEVGDGVYVHANHMLDPGLRALEVGRVPRASSYFRQARMETLANSDAGIADLKRFLADREGGERAICRHDFGGITTNAAVILDPAERVLEAHHGPPTDTGWRRFEVRQ